MLQTIETHFCNERKNLNLLQEMFEMHSCQPPSPNCLTTLFENSQFSTVFARLNLHITEARWFFTKNGVSHSRNGILLKQLIFLQQCIYLQTVQNIYLTNGKLRQFARINIAVCRNSCGS